MIDFGQNGIRTVSFAAADNPRAPVEVVRRSVLIERMGSGFFDRPDRPTFDMLMLVHRGVGTHTIDFNTVALGPGCLLRTRPGQVQSWDLGADIEASIILSTDITDSWKPETEATCNLDESTLATANAVIDSICREQESPNPRSAGDVSVHMFRALAAIFDRDQTDPPGGPYPEAYRAFCNAVEMDLGASVNAQFYADQLGYSARTITRACQLVTGLTAKGVLDQRITLEAKRLLTNTEHSGQQIAHNLGFSEPTNFVKFFRRQVGLSPNQFRDRYQAPLSASPVD